MGTRSLGYDPGVALPGFVRPLLQGLRFPYLFAIAVLALFVDLVVPDAIPLVDEVLLVIVSTMLGMWKTSKRDRKLHESTVDEPKLRNAAPQPDSPVGKSRRS